MAEPIVDETVGGAGSVDHVAGLTEDVLGFRPYVEALFSYLKNKETKAPFTVSIEGDWGSGKSSFMFQLEQSLKKDNQKVIRFNAWRHDKVESMWAAFALHFIKDLLDHLNPICRIFANIKLRIKRFDFVRGWFTVFKTLVLLGFYAVLVYLFFIHYNEFSAKLFKEDKISWETLIPVFGGAGVIIGLLFFLKGLSEVTGNPFKTDLQKFVNKPNYEGNVAFIEEFHRDFQKTINVLSEGEDKIFVFVDDLDRAEIPKAAELMQGLNMMISDSAKIIFIIGMDREKVAAGIAAKYKDLLPFLNPDLKPLDTEAGLEQAQSFGYNFLEKFIQLSFHIPKASPFFTERFIDSLSNSNKDLPNTDTVKYNPVLVVKNGADSIQFRAVSVLLAPFFEHNPRRIKQFVNIFRLKAHIANSTGLFVDYQDSKRHPLSIPQLGKFVAITILFPQFLDDVALDASLVAKLINDPSISNEWGTNKTFMDLLRLAPAANLIDINFDMRTVNYMAMIETMPVYAYETVSAPTPTPGPAQTPSEPPLTTTTTEAPPTGSNRRRAPNAPPNAPDSGSYENFGSKFRSDQGPEAPSEAGESFK